MFHVLAAWHAVSRKPMLYVGSDVSLHIGFRKC